MSYLPRIIERELDELAADAPAIAIQGPKGVGKTVTATQRAQSVIRLDTADGRTLVSAYPDRLMSLQPPVLLDEWQRQPQVWDLVRRAVDDGAPAGQFLLTGSAWPAGAEIHSGAGRIIDVRMRPLSLAERGLGEPTVSLDRLLTSGADIGGETDVTLADYVAEIIASGLPGIRSSSPRMRRGQLRGYIDHIATREFPELGTTVRRPATLRAWMSAYAAATSMTASYNSILDAATPAEAEKPAKTTTIHYRDVLSQLWLLDPVEAWLPADNELRRLGSAPKHGLADPGLAAALLELSEDDLLSGGPRSAMLGPLFEQLVALSLKVYAQHAEARLGHLRFNGGEREIDLIAHRGSRVVAIEVKLSRDPPDRELRHLHWLRDRLGDRLSDAVVVTSGRYAYRRPDGIAVIPAALLGP
jgi:uncharacterized protein